MTIAAVWVAVSLLLWELTAVGGRFTFGGSDTARRFRSQADTLGRIFAIVVVLAVVVVALVTVDQVRSLGTTVLAGAGLIGAIAGLAAQKTLANVFAGIAIGFNNTLNLGDVVEVDGESGEVVQRTLTYVVLKLSDQRQLVLPTSSLLDKSHRNWKLTRHRVVGWVPLEVDWTVPVPELEQALKDYLEGERPGDEDRVRVEVIGVADSRVQVRAMVIDTPDDLWGLQCAVRRHLVEWIRAHYPEAIPRMRADVTLPAPQPASSSSRKRTPTGTHRSDRKGKEKVRTDQ
jgi:small-conductance mechanosensitive channel